MTIYFLFGKTGSGKSYIGELLEQLKIIHIDGDAHLTQKMRDCLIEDEQMTPEMIDEFVDVLIEVIRSKKVELPKQSFVVSQALYLDKHRLKLLKTIPDLKFVMIDVTPVIRASRVTSRFRNKESKVSLHYANQMDKFFEVPSHDVILLENNKASDEALIAEIQKKLPALFNIESEEELDNSIPLQPA